MNDDNHTVNDQVRNWIRFADDDLRYARDGVEMGAQQAVETAESVHSVIRFQFVRMGLVI